MTLVEQGGALGIDLLLGFLEPMLTLLDGFVPCSQEGVPEIV
jgi:hypothetical protein